VALMAYAVPDSSQAVVTTSGDRSCMGSFGT
jgi:hypothetical protein